MTQVNPSIVTSSHFSGFKNYSKTPTFSASIAGGALAVNSERHATATITLDNTSAITQLQVQWSGADSIWRVIPGQLSVDFPDWTSPSYQLETQMSFSGGILSVKTYAVNETPGSITLPAITINCEAFLFVAPFNL